MVRWSSLLVLLVVGLAWSTTVNLSGKVVNKDGSPMQSAVVRLLHTSLRDVTKSDGTWHLQGSTAIKSQPHFGSTARSFSIKVLPGSIDIRLASSGRTKIDVYTIDGRNIFSFDRLLPAGTNSIPHLRISSSCYILRAQVGSSIYQERLVNTNRPTAYLDHGMQAGLRKMLDTTSVDSTQYDTLEISKDSLIIVDTVLSSLVDTLPPTFIIQREIYGHIPMVTVGKVVAVLWETDYPQHQQLLTLETMVVDGSIRFSTFAYFTADYTKKFSVYVKVYSTDSSNYIGCSSQYDFSNRYGNVDVGTIVVNTTLPDPPIGQALPIIVVIDPPELPVWDTTMVPVLGALRDVVHYLKGSIVDTQLTTMDSMDTIYDTARVAPDSTVNYRRHYISQLVNLTFDFNIKVGSVDTINCSGTGTYVPSYPQFGSETLLVTCNLSSFQFSQYGGSPIGFVGQMPGRYLGSQVFTSGMMTVTYKHQDSLVVRVDTLGTNYGEMPGGIPTYDIGARIPVASDSCIYDFGVNLDSIRAPTIGYKFYDKPMCNMTSCKYGDLWNFQTDSTR